jgi:HlyD family secretion protein
MNRPGLVGTLLLTGMVVAVTYLNLGTSKAKESEFGRDVASSDETTMAKIVECPGRVESRQGSVDVYSDLSGRLDSVLVDEGDTVLPGSRIAIIDAWSEKGQMESAHARLLCSQRELRKKEIGVGKEELEASRSKIAALEAERVLASLNTNRSRELFAKHAEAARALDENETSLKSLVARIDSAQKEYKALLRGGTPEDMELARAQVSLSEAQLAEASFRYSKRFVLAPTRGTVVKRYRTRGDFVSIYFPTPIVRILDAEGLRIRAEIPESEVYNVQAGLGAQIFVPSQSEQVGIARTERLVPEFGAKRLFSSDITQRIDVRTIELLCEIKKASVILYPGQRVTLRIQLLSGRNLLKGIGEQGSTKRPLR